MYVCMYTSIVYPPEKCLTHFSLTNIAGNHTVSGKCCMHWPIFLSSSTVFFPKEASFSKKNAAHFEGLFERITATVEGFYFKVMVHCLKEYCTLFKNCFTPVKSIPHCFSGQCHTFLKEHRSHDTTLWTVEQIHVCTAILFQKSNASIQKKNVKVAQRFPEESSTIFLSFRKECYTLEGSFKVQLHLRLVKDASINSAVFFN